MLKIGDKVRLRTPGGWIWNFENYGAMAKDGRNIRFNWDTVYGVIQSLDRTYARLTLFRLDGVQVSLTLWDEDHPTWSFDTKDLILVATEKQELPPLEEN